jgi:hypothetical protein
LVGAADAHIQDDPVQATGTDVGVADTMQLPGPCDREVPPCEEKQLIIDREMHLPPGDIGEFDAFVAVPIQPP